MTWINKQRWGFGYYDDPPATPPPEEKKFTQADVDRIAAEERRKYQTKQQELTTQMEDLKKNSALSQTQRDDLQKKIDELQQQYLTKEQLAAQKLEKERAAEKLQIEELTQHRDGYKGLFESTIVESAILKAASTHEAFSSEQLKDLLFGKAKVVEEKDDAGKTIKHNVVIKTTMTDPKTKQLVPVELPVDEAVKQMKDQPEKFGNLFKSGVAGGLGGGSGKGGKPFDIKTATDAEYRAFRVEQGLARKKE